MIHLRVQCQRSVELRKLRAAGAQAVGSDEPGSGEGHEQRDHRMEEPKSTRATTTDTNQIIN